MVIALEDKGVVIGGREKRSEIVEWSGTVWRCLLRYIPLVAWRRADVNDSMKSGISRDRGSMMLWPLALMLSCAMRRVWCSEGRTRDLCHNTIPYYHASAICPHHSMLPVVPGPPSPSSPPTAAVRRPRHLYTTSCS